MQMLVSAAVLIATLIFDSAGTAGEPTPDPRAACQAAFARASRRLADTIRFKVGRCIAAGARCLARTDADSSTCCTTGAPRCRAQQATLTRAARHFAERVASGPCARIDFAAVLDPEALGYQSAVQACACFPTPVDVTDLGSLGVCVARLLDAETTRLVAVAEAPRAAEALTCIGLDQQLAMLAESDAALACDRIGPTPSAGPAPTATSLVTRTTSATGTFVTAHTPAATPTPAAPTSALTGSRVPTPTATTTPVCGNGIVEGDEECDGAAFDTESCAEDVCTCEDFCDDAGGQLACALDCMIDFSHCTATGCEF